MKDKFRRAQINATRTAGTNRPVRTPPTRSRAAPSASDVEPGVFCGSLGVVPVDPDLPGLADPAPLPDQRSVSEETGRDLHPVEPVHVG